MTIKDVAKLANVSKSTVSRYLNNGYVSESNKQKIQEAINEIGYKTNVFARGLKTNRSQLIAVVIPRLDSYTAVQTLKGMHKVFAEQGYQIVTVPKSSIEEDEFSYLQKLSTQGFDGIIIMSHAITDKHVKLAKTVDTPILFSGQFHEETDNILLDDYDIGRSLALHVNKTQAKNVIYLGVSESDPAVGYNRKKGFLDTVKAETRSLVTGFQMEDAYKTMALESSTLKYDCIACATDNIALGAIRFLKDKGISIPSEVQVIGVGNYDFGHIVSPSLSTIEVDYQTYGFNVAHKMLSRLSKDMIYNPKKVSINFIQRESSIEVKE